MVKLYTKSGDEGKSGLIGAHGIPKSDPVFNVLGTFDELSAHIGLSVVVAEGDTRKELLSLQDFLMKVGAEIAGSDKFALTEKDCTFLEDRIDAYQKQTRKDWYTKFLLPGGTELAARLDVTRAICRRLEREVVDFAHGKDTFQLILKYCNRLSDYFFALRCFVNSKAGYEEKEFDSEYPQKDS